METLLEQSVATQERLIEIPSLRMSEIIASLSAALDITEGQPVGHASRSCLFGMRLAAEIGLPADDQFALFYALLLKDLGCSSNAAKLCWLFGADDRKVKHDLKTVDWSRMTEAFRFTWRSILPGASPLQKAMQFVAMMREGNEGSRKIVETRCERGAEIVRMLRFPEASAETIRSLDEHWDGSGQPVGLRGEQIPLLARIAGLAQTFEVFFSGFGLNRAYEVLEERSGAWFDPSLVAACRAFRGETGFWKRLAGPDVKQSLDAYEPPDFAVSVGEDDLDRVCEAFAQVVDAKSPWTFKHSQGVAKIAADIASHLGYRGQMLRDVRRAGLLHDIGKLGVSNLILDKPGKPTDEEFAEIRKHPLYTEQILAPIGGFAKFCDTAASHHERLDGRGYHRRVEGQNIPPIGKILVVADVYEALAADRPYRDSMPQEKIWSIMEKESGVGFDPDCVRALKETQLRQATESRVNDQLEAIEQLVASI